MKLSIDEKKRHEKLASGLRAAFTELSEKVDAYNEVVLAHKAEIDAAKRDFDERMAECGDFAQDVCRDLADSIGEKSEKWQESDAGQAAQALQDAWEGFTMTDADVQTPDELDAPDEDAVTEFEELPTE